MGNPLISDVHPELQRVANRIPNISVTPRNLWFWRLLTNLHRTLGLSKDVRVENRFIPDRDNKTKIRVRVYRPASLASLVPGLLWLHGGGYVFGRPEMDDAVCVQMAGELGIVIASVDYRVAPRYPFPSSLHDAYTVLRWLHSRGRQIGVDNRIAIGGESAGAGLAAALAQLACDRKEIQIAGQILVYPMLDDRTCIRTDMDIPFPSWTQQSNRFGWESYLGLKYGVETVPEYSVPARRADLSGLPQPGLASERWTCSMMKIWHMLSD